MYKKILLAYDGSEAGQQALLESSEIGQWSQARMRLMREQVQSRNVYRWAGQMLLDAARLRKRERISKFVPPTTRVPAGTPA